MAIILIAAMDRKRAIGKDGGLPWGQPIPADMGHFRMFTLREVVVMGRRTYDSLNLIPLRERVNVVLTRGKELAFDSGVIVVHDSEAIRVTAKIMHAAKKDVYIIGGAGIYKEFLPDASRMYLTCVDGDFGGDTYFPEHNTHEWRTTARRKHNQGALSPYNLEFVTLDRVSLSA